jgi:hypothetical protein
VARAPDVIRPPDSWRHGENISNRHLQERCLDIGYSNTPSYLNCDVRTAGTSFGSDFNMASLEDDGMLN